MIAVEEIFPVNSLERQPAFWQHDPVELTLIGVFMQDFMLRDIYLAAQEGELLQAGKLRAELFFNLFLQRHNKLKKVDQDLIRPVEPINSVPWLEGILGMDLRVHAQSVWAEPLLGKREFLSDLHPRINDEWLETTIGFVQELVEQFHPNIPVAEPFLRGPADVVPAMIGMDRFCYELIDHPGEVERLLQFCAQTWVDVYQQVIEMIPEWNNGYVPGARWIFSPGECVYSSEDASGLISPRMYQRFILPVNQFMASHFPYGYIHRHSDSIQHIEMLLEMPSGWAIEVTIDPVGPSINEIMLLFKRIQETDRPLIIFGLDDPLKINELIAGLSPKGLCVISHADNPGCANQLAAAAKMENLSALEE